MWKASANLVAGDELLTEDGRVVYVKEVRIERLAESIKVYNLEVEGLHTYYVGSGILVHNEYGGKKNVSDSNESGSNPDVKDLIDDIPDKLKTNGKCNQFAQNLTKRLDEKGIPYKIIRVDSLYGIYSDKAGTEIGLGFHYGIQIDDLVYDNMTTGGMKFNDWLKDLGIGFPGIDWDYAEKINSH
ncbi:MAG: hypothetical protein IJA10_16040 [Lachnospiraceae bacterium]|nr:hypothetical protein [Lachnospiraceae bacterium]